MAKRTSRDRRPRQRVDGVVEMDEAYVEEQKAEQEAGSEVQADDGPEPQTEGDEEPQAVDPDEGALTFGDDGKAWLTLEISEDKQQATVKALSFAGEEHVKGNDVVAVLRERGNIHHGFKRDGLKEAIKKARDESVARGQFVVAQGTPPEPGADGSVNLKFVPETEEKVSISYQAIKDALAKDELEAVLESDLAGALVAPGELLATMEPPTAGKPGKDVHGETLTQPGKEAELKLGESVDGSDEGFAAQGYGYACFLGDELSVVSPIWISSDAQEAHLVHLPQVREEPTPQSEWLLQALQLKRVTSGIDEVAIEKLCQATPAATEKCTVVLAKGVPPVNGTDAYVKYDFDAEKRAGQVLEDGTIDFRERNVAISVQADALLGEVIAATEGQDGATVKGEQVAATDGQDKSFTAGQNVRSESDGEALKFYAEIEGTANIAGETIEVLPMYTISGDLNYETGNIDLPTNVDIGGNVCSGFTVKAGGSVTIGGSVENGASVNAKGDVIAAKGIFGADTKVVALGNVETKFIQNSTVMAQENITVGAYVINALARAGAEVKVEEGGGPRAGSIIGGEVIATKGIHAKLIGSADTDRTVVGIGPNAEQLEQLNRLKAIVGNAHSQIPKLVSQLGLPKADEAELHSLMERLPERRKQELIEPAVQLRKLMQSQESALREQAELEGKLPRRLRRVR